MDLTCLFLPDRVLPRKALDVIDEAGARVRLKSMTRPPDIRELDEQIERLNSQKEEAVVEQDFEKAAGFRDQADKLKKIKDGQVRQWREQAQESDGVVDEQVVIEAVSFLTGYPLEAVLARDTSILPVAVRNAFSSVGVPEYERKQAESVLQGSIVQIRRGTGFVLLPHTDEFDGIFDTAVRPAMEANGIDVTKANDIYNPGFILGQVWQQILSSEVVVADVSGINPNVIFELGLCYGLHRSPILLVRNPDELPFNLRSLRYIKYENTARGAKALQDDLTRAIEAFLAVARAEQPKS